MEIPPHTTIAYGLIELEVKCNGHYGEETFVKARGEVCLFLKF